MTAPEEPPVYLRLQNISKHFGTFHALRDVSLSIRKGEFVCFLGPSGCGKTTLLRAIAGLDPQNSGRIEQDGRDISRLPPAQRDFGIVFQSYALFPNLTAAENIGYGLRNRGVPGHEIRARVEQLATLVHLYEHLHKYPSQLSGGQQQRVALARALALSPGLLLLDEPLSALDAQVRQFLRREIKEVHRRLGITTIMVTHDQEEALTLSDRIVLMNRGVIEQVGTPTELYRTPRTAFAAAFVGQSNFLPGRLRADGTVAVNGVPLRPGVGVQAGMPDEPVQICLRPEQVELRPAGAGGYPAQVTDVEFCGSFWRVTLSVEALGCRRLVADVPPALGGALALAEGAAVDALVPDGVAQVFPEVFPEAAA
ncbi:putative 2-aminoethylphosphonate ABC transporter ATP-binding protein [Azospirillum sp. TSO22-1]|uniref:putative 2-aminoethylphosphonate ABC transporter ATP-binding protein n=1 Tax=Azospirillum sp. TSO22-1 TaxID=716789 RepID=UPI000D608DC6|nr:putative 2-aminoethylphosphonate ABC transporter ATP-binding protein [Azospirillum sp. TSO22-1]PWC31691.1 hypothetical protein TSO221_33195 [Azospirillum sp. TSO22-1]